MDAAEQARQQKKQELLRELAELLIQEQVQQGVFLETAHFRVIERAAMKLGRDLSRQAQERGAREAAALCGGEAACPGCGAVCRVEIQQRPVASVDGPLTLSEAVADCPACRRAFFPSAGRLGPG